MAVELIPIQEGQHSVVLVPRATNDLPFFYLTKQKASLSENIDYQGVDISGRPMRWQVFPSNNRVIGAPSIKAHEVWYRLIKPMIDQWLNRERDTPEIIPLGKVRECLRVVGWTEGGFEARDFLRCLRQIGAAWCVADLWIPTTAIDEQGNTIFEHINAEFSKLTLYAIGKTHLTEQQINSGNFKFDFDIEDTVYIQLHPVEAQIQKNQPQKYIDNQYLFSVSPAARRWYELMAGKIFGVIKNKGAFCEIRYSWYVKHHHTLKHHVQHKRVTEQMNEIVKDHLAADYIRKVEYRKIKESDHELDFIIRYYPGEAAKESIARIQGHIYHRRSERQQLAAALKMTKAIKEPAEQGSRPTEPITTTLSTASEQDNQLVQELIINFQVAAIRAMSLVQHHRASAVEQLAAFPYRAASPKNRAGWMIEAIEKNYTLPDEYIQSKQKEADRKKLLEQQERAAACALCDEAGFRYVKSERYPMGAAKKCSHDTEIEKQYETA